MLPREHYLKQTYQDPMNFPNGFEKGGLSDIQARLVKKQGALIVALCSDEVSDPTADDLHILKVIANQAAPKSPIEQAWIKYQNIVKANQAAAKPAKKPAKAKAKTTETAADADTAEAPAATKSAAKPKAAKASKKVAEKS